MKSNNLHLRIDQDLQFRIKNVLKLVNICAVKAGDEPIDKSKLLRLSIRKGLIQVEKFYQLKAK